MFNRSANNDGSRNGQDGALMDRLRPEPARQAQATAPVRAAISIPNDMTGHSVIGRDLTIMGEQITIISRGSLQVDAEIQGNLRSVELVVGESAKVEGTVAAETVVVRGEVKGAVRGVKVSLQSSARVEGDLYYKSLSIDEGAVFDGHSHRSDDMAELLPDGPRLEPKVELRTEPKKVLAADPRPQTTLSTHLASRFATN